MNSDDMTMQHGTPHPDSVQDQRDLIDNEWDWLIWMDGGRFDYFSELYHEYFEGDLRACWNGGVGYSGDWADRMLRQDFSGKGLFSVLPVRSLQYSDYDGREYFDVAPVINEDDGPSIMERLAALGYRERTGPVVDVHPDQANAAVRDHIDDLDGGVIRYLKPHPPFEGIVGMTAGSGKVRHTMRALRNGKLTQEELAAAYRDTYRVAFEGAIDIIPELSGDVVVTADHGECLGDCGQVFHSRTHEPHEHLCTVPWLDVDGIK